MPTLMACRPVRPLTPRLEAVARELATGKNATEIGQALGISPRTAQHHVERIAELLPADEHEAMAPRDRAFLWAYLTYRPAAA